MIERCIVREFLGVFDSLPEDVPRHDGLDCRECILTQRLGVNQGGTDLREQAHLLVDRVPGFCQGTLIGMLGLGEERSD